MSIRKYAESKGVSDTTIRKMRGKRLSHECFGIDENNNRPFIYKELADVDWLENFDPAYERVTKADKKALKEGTKQKPTGTGQSLQQTKYAEQKANRENVEYQLAALKLLEKQGTLVQKSKVYETLYAFGESIRMNLQDIPDNHLDEILAAGATGDRDAAHKIFTEAIDQVLIRLTTIDTTVRI
jgi:hypothetical protein